VKSTITVFEVAWWVTKIHKIVAEVILQSEIQIILQ